MPDQNARLAELVVSKLATLDHAILRQLGPDDGGEYVSAIEHNVWREQRKMLRGLLREAGIEAAERKDG